MPSLASGLSWIDLEFRGHAEVVATAVVSGEGELALIDPGPTSCLDTLERGLCAQGASLEDVTHILLTHVHLDHAGATGTLLRRCPRAKVIVHELGAPHLVDPGRLIGSATRLYGDQMARLWEEIAAVPASNLVVVGSSRQTIDAAGRRFEVAYTPGHAIHHVSFFDESSGVAFVGDAAGIRIHGRYVRPPTPPPDIDVESWTRTAARIRAWNPQTMVLTHFGPSTEVGAHLDALVENLSAGADLVRRSLLEPGTDDDKARRYADYVERELGRYLTAGEAAPHHVGASFEVSWHGLARYWRKKSGQARRDQDPG
jgi:glyoxylase-like metal-dependent hydrolase (beta-lactamase superfamily II)